jgi:class 3 adenylate cyclase/predicted ATPase
MQCSNCGSENRADSAFCEQCGRKLELLCPACTAPVGAGARFCRKCGTGLSTTTIHSDAIATRSSSEGWLRLLTDETPTDVADGERKTVTALFADIKGSTELMEDLDPEMARAIVDPALKLMIEAVRRYDGYVVQSTGDGIFALFGAPVAHEDHPQRALYAALRMQEDLRRYSAKLVADGGSPIQGRIGVNTGEVVVRVLETGHGHAEYTPIGHSTNLAARMQNAAPVGSIAVTEATRRLSEGYFTLKALGVTRVKGLSEPVNVYEVTGLGPLRTRLQRAAARGLTKFVGRQREMDALHRALEQAKSGHGQVMAAMADHGVGKSRLFYEFKALSHSGCVALEAYSVSHGKASAYLPVIELLREYFEIGSDDDERKRRERVLGKVLGLDRRLEDTVPYFYSLLGIAEAGDSLARMDPNIKHRRTLEAIKRVLLRESLNQPLILFFEDLHWLDGETQALLNLLVDAITNARILLLVNYRPEYRHEWGSRTHYTQLRLDPLGRETAAEMLSELLGNEPELGPLKRLIADKTEGNPFFVEEIVQALFEQGFVARNGRVTLKRSLGQITIPPTVQALLASRIDRLPPDEKVFLQMLAVLGREFSLTLLRRVVRNAEGELERILADLQHGEFIYEQPAFPDTEYCFKHALTQEVAYNSVLLEQRKQFHEDVAQAIEELFQPQLKEHFTELAYHYSRSGNAQEAVKYLQLAGQQAMQRSAHGEAVTHLNAALDLLKMLPETAQRIQRELALQISLGIALTAVKGAAAPEIEAAYTRARELSHNRADAAELFPALWGLFLLYFLRGNRQAADELAEQLFNLALGVDDPILVAIAHYVMANNLYNAGEFASSCRHFEQSLSLYKTHGRRTLSLMGEELGVVSRGFMSFALWPLGYPERALRQVEEGLRLARELKSPYDLALALWTAANLHQWRREPQPIRERAEAAMAIAAELGLSWLTAGGSTLVGWALVQQNQPEDGIRQILRGIEAYTEGGYLLDYNLPLLADAYCNIGQAEAGLAILNDATNLQNKTGTHYYEAELYRLQGELLLKQDRNKVAQAENCFRHAIEVARKQSARSWQLRATTSLARLLASRSRREEARTMLAEIYNWFTEGFDTADLKDASALLEELGGSAAHSASN